MIHKAAQGNKPSAIIYFSKKYNMDLEATENNKLNALHLATISGMDNSVIFLLSLGINPNIQDSKGYTALHYAVRYGHIRIIKKLLQKGADRNIKDNKSKKTPVMMAKNRPEIMEIFREKGICEKLFFKPDITAKNFYSNQNMVLFLILHIIIICLTFFILMPYFNNTTFSIIYLIISFIIFFLYILLCFSNPGIMINKEYKDLLDIVEKGEEADNFCPYCLVKHKYRSKHCLVCEKCIEEFDHHCFWVGNCIGKNNYTLFFIFLIYVNLNTLFNFGIICYYLLKEIIYGYDKKENQNFPGFYLGNSDSFIYNKYVRIIISIFIFVICILFFIPLIDLFKIQLSNAIERRRNRIDEEEYEKNRLTEKLDEEDENIKSDAKVKPENEVWKDIVYRQSIDTNDGGN
jgi:palmitoyltransferase